MRPSQSLIRYSSKTAEQNFMKHSGIVHYIMPYCNSYFKFLSSWFWGFPEQNNDFVITTYGGGGYPSLIRYSSKTAEQNFMKVSGIVHDMMPYCTSYFKFLSAWSAWRHMGGDPSLILYSSKTAEQNFMKLSGIVHYMMSYCTSYFKFLFEWFWGFPEQNKDFAIQNMGERGISFYEHCSQYF